MASVAGKLFLDDRALEFGADAGIDGPRTLVFRPHHVDVVDRAPGRHHRPRRLRAPPRRRAPPRGRDRQRRHPIEIDVSRRRPRRRKGDRISLLPNRWWLFDEAKG